MHRAAAAAGGAAPPLLFDITSGDDGEAAAASSAMRWFKSKPQSLQLDSHGRPTLEPHSPSRVSGGGGSAATLRPSHLLSPEHYLGQNAFHTIALTGSAHALSLLLSTGGGTGVVVASTPQGGGAGGDDDGAVPRPSPSRAAQSHLSSLLSMLLETDGFGLTPLQRAYECYRLSPASPRLLAMVRLLLATRVLLAAAVGEHLLTPSGSPLATPRHRLRASSSRSSSARRTTEHDDTEQDEDEEEEGDGGEYIVQTDSSEGDGTSSDDDVDDPLPPLTRGGPDRLRRSGTASTLLQSRAMHAPALASTEEEVMGDGSWIFGQPLPDAPYDAAAVVALETLRGTDAAYSGGPSGHRSVLVELAVHACMPALLELEDGAAAEEAAAQPAAAAAMGGSGGGGSFGEALLRAHASDGATLLVAAAGAGAAPIVARLLEGERRPSCPPLEVAATTDGGQSALHVAAQGCHREVCALLFARTGLPLNQKPDALGRTPADLCPPRFREELRDLFAASSQAGGGGARFATLHKRIVPPTAPLIAGRFAVHTSVGKRVVLAEDVMSHRPCALKWCETQASLEREATLLGIVGPEFAPEVYETLYDEGGGPGRQHVLVMECADPNYSTPSSCSELAHFCRRRREGLEARTHALRLIHCILALHDRSLVHTDLKLEHFMRFGGEWKLVDLGAVVEDGTTCIPACTVRYAAPEVAAAVLESTPLRVTGAIDVWALGVILYELFAGRRSCGRASSTSASSPTRRRPSSTVGVSRRTAPSTTRRGGCCSTSSTPTGRR